jgi:hypothetical protein
MEGDFTRNSDDRESAYSGVLMQQGRVQLDADWNEQGAIQTRALRNALRDIIGQHGGPAKDLGFSIAQAGANSPNLTIGTGVYYVDGIRVVQRDVEAMLPMTGQAQGDYLAFLDVWERHVNVIEDPRLREVALLGPDTATRSEVLWRVRLLKAAGAAPNGEGAASWADDMVQQHLRARPRLRLAARALTSNTDTDPCQLSPLAQYRGRENQLYRVQIHDAWPKDANTGDGGRDPALFTFKWSRDNGSVVFPIVRVAGAESPAAAGDQEIEVTVTVGNLGRDDRFGLVAGDIVEFVHDALTRETLDHSPLVAEGRDPGRAGLLGRVLAPIDRDDLAVRVAVYAHDIAEITEGTLHPYLRRWDHRPSAKRGLVRGAIPVRQSELGQWLALENGVEVQFEGPPEQPMQPEQRAGDYWQIPARVATGDVIWPTEESGAAPERKPVHLTRHGPTHHFAPLAIVHWNGSTVTSVFGVRRKFDPIAKQG